MQRDDSVRMRHMLDAARSALSFAHGRTRDDLNEDEMLVFSLVKAVEIVGEAANQITENKSCLRSLGRTSSVCATVSSTPISTSILMCSGRLCNTIFLP